MKKYLTFEKFQGGYDVHFDDMLVGELYPLDDGIYVWEQGKGWRG